MGKKKTHPRPAAGLASPKRACKSKVAAAAINQATHLPNAQLPPEIAPVPAFQEAPKATSTAEELVQAAARGDQERLTELLKAFDGDFTDAMVAAASNGHLNCVERLREELWWDDPYLASRLRQITREGMAPAAANGCVDVVRVLLRGITPDAGLDEEGAWTAFLEGATNGHLEVVKVAANAVPPCDKNFELHVATAMSNAISGGFADVVAFLLTWEHWKGDAGKVFEKAIANEQHEVAEKVYDTYPMVNRGGNLLVDLAARGCTDAVKYLYDHGHKDSSVLTRALECATENNCSAVVKFLKVTARVGTAPAF
jgi:hypothetical protein